ncbi:MAG: PfkB family carbohydrate kinase [Rhodoferax sp.]|nr:PfkB family carbohydrate kinase [Rhodoferax sp.]
MPLTISVLGEALMDCIAQADGSLLPLLGGSPFNLARAAALRGAKVSYLNPLSDDAFGRRLATQLEQDDVTLSGGRSSLPTSLAVIQMHAGQPSYGFYREGIADRDYSVASVLAQLQELPPGVLHSGSLMLLPPEHDKVLPILEGAKRLGWTISIDTNLRPKLAADLARYVAAVHAASRLADWIKASDEDLELLGFGTCERAQSPTIADHFRALGCSRIALTFGGQGAWLEVDGAQASAEVPPTDVVDTVGAGDTFWGNCLGDWATFPEDSASRVSQTLQDAMQAAAINCSRPGCQPPRYDEIRTARV